MTITAAHFGTAPMRTDRGIATMSAWLFTATGAEGGDLTYPAVPGSAIWGGNTQQSWNGDAAVISADGLLLTYFFTGAKEGTGPCQANYKGAIAETNAVVRISTEAIPGQPTNGPNGQPLACTAEGYRRSVNVTLARPLGGRVVVDARGNAVPVCPAGTKTGC
jgi:hypothetical protein